MACLALLLDSVWVATPETALWLLQGWPPTSRVACSHLTTPLDTPCYLALGRGGGESRQEFSNAESELLLFVYISK
jgi:hypothetical protein